MKSSDLLGNRENKRESIVAKVLMVFTNIKEDNTWSSSLNQSDQFIVLITAIMPLQKERSDTGGGNFGVHMVVSWCLIYTTQTDLQLYL